MLSAGCGEERVVKIELAHRGAVGPGRPFGVNALRTGHAEHAGAAVARVTERLRPGVGDGRAVDGGDGDGRIVDDAVDHHGGDVVVDLDGVDGDGGDLPGQLILARQGLFRWIYFNRVILHDF